MEMYNPAHPGKILKMGYLDELNMSIAETALKLGVSRQALYDLINEKSALTPVMALKIAKAFNSRPGLWMDLQTQYDLWHAKQTTNLDDVQVITG
ncbi:MAG: HigA family addiction module antidote protein [Heliobacteriaceae bacterium]|jgi:addiction module HigA family antidote|nr:HigA family addiction module antidote protein [Heliobacteriaceae bacterium]